MTLLGNPDYRNSQVLTLKELEELTEVDLVENYLILRADFCFPNTVKYPSIPCYMDDSMTVYPVTGQAYLTGSEYLTAYGQGCEFEIFEIVHIPWMVRAIWVSIWKKEKPADPEKVNVLTVTETHTSNSGIQESSGASNG